MASSGLTRVYRVTEVSIRPGTVSDTFSVFAKGQTRQGGWTDIQLRPASGPHIEQVMLLEMVGRKPDVGTEAITSVTAKDYEIKPPSNVHSVLVKAEENEMGAAVPGRKS